MGISHRSAIGPAAALLALALAQCSKPAGPAPAADTPSASASSNPAASPSAAASAAASAASGASVSDDLLGKPAPDFTATAQDGTVVHLAALKGKPVVVYFYPKDETPGCTKEACAFRDSWQALTATGAVLVGISADTLDSHKGFASNHKLPFLLVSDPDGAIGQKFGVPFHVVHQRQTFVVGADGVVKRVYRHVDVGAHAEQILGDLKT
jgi:peroxiredoxin Q/BCP